MFVKLLLLIRAIDRGQTRGGQKFATRSSWCDFSVLLLQQNERARKGNVLLRRAIRAMRRMISTDDKGRIGAEQRVWSC